MTDTLDRSDLDDDIIDLTDPPPPAEPEPSAPATSDEPEALSPRRLTGLIALWLLVTILGVYLVLYQVGPLVQQRDQRALLGEMREELVAAANAAYGLPGATAPTRATAIGTPIAVLDSSDLSLRQGAGPQQTRRGPGHVVGTAGPGQPGNSVIVGRRSLAGGPFGKLGDLEVGDPIRVTTTQGASVYIVGHVGEHAIVDGDTEGETDEIVDMYGDVDTSVEDAEEASLLADGDLTIDEIQGPTEDDWLTLMTSTSANPLATDEAMVVVATLDGIPFTPTPQGGRTAAGDGRSGESIISAPIVLAVLFYAAVVAATVVAYRRLRWRSAYLLSAPPLVAATMILAEQVLRAFPAWS